MKRNPVACLLLACGMLLHVAPEGAAQTGASLWSDYQTRPNNHPNLPNNSFAGYRNGEVPIPTVPQVNQITSFGGSGNNSTDNTAAFKAAIEDAGKKGGGAVFIPTGTYIVNGYINLKESGVVLRGAGTGSTVIKFTKPLQTTMFSMTTGTIGTIKWSWTGGLIWVAPSKALNSKGYPTNPSGTVASGTMSTDEWEQWRSGWVNYSGTHYNGLRLANLSATAAKGAFTVTVDSSAKLKAGQYVLMTWKNDTTTNALKKHITNHSLMDSWSYSTSPGFTTTYRWPVQIASISGNSVTLKEPLRLDARSEFAVGFEPIDYYIQEAGIENLKIVMSGTVQKQHNQNDGYNAIFFNQAINCWVKNVVVENAENGLFVSQVKNITATGVTINGPSIQMHHATANRFQANNVLIDNFTINAPVMHGINVEAASAGNVWSKGTMANGTFDSHRNLPFDNIRTEITVKNNGSPGGANDAGPYNGKSVVHWNVNITGTTGLYINQPDAHSMGALVGVRGYAQDNSCAWAMICGNKGTIVADAGLTPSPANLHASQLSFRKSKGSYVHLGSHYDGQTIVPATSQTLKAEGNVISGRSISKVDFYDGSTFIASDTSAPYSVAWNSVAKGYHTLRAVLTDSAAATTQHQIRITAANRLKVENTDPGISYSGFSLVSGTNYSGGSIHNTCSTTATATYTFKGTRIQIYTYNVKSGEQRWKVFIDNMTTSVAAYTIPRIDAPDFLVYDSGELTDGNHTVKIMTNNSNCVALDYFMVWSTL